METKARQACKSPCVYQKFRVAKSGRIQAEQDKSFILLKFNPTVVKRMLVPNYEPFDFVVDLGSSLGLWLGLSALSILDLGPLLTRVLKRIQG